MRIVPMPEGVLRAGHALPMSLRDTRGGLVVARGTLVPAGTDIASLRERGLWADADEVERWQRKDADTSLVTHAVARQPDDAAAAFWLGLPERANQVLRNPAAAGFLVALTQLHDDLTARADREPDKALMALIRLASVSADHYSATHGLLCAVAASLVARQLPGWLPADRRALGLAALSMNIWMTELQDELAKQRSAPTVAQRAALANHAPGAVKLLRDAGVDDDDWLQAVAHHHDAVPGPLAGRGRGQQMARVLQRVDLFTARLSPRRTRAAMSASAAAQAAYSGEDGRPDEAGMLLIRALGIYPPGCLVRLASDERGVVLRRGAKANQPQVAAISDRSGRLLPLEAWRISQQPIVAALAPQDCVLDLQLGRLLALAAEPAPARTAPRGSLVHEYS
jgi:HD-GYP domain-containing protein (c-di-GMP phosphodiesterase class II)